MSIVGQQLRKNCRIRAQLMTIRTLPTVYEGTEAGDFGRNRLRIKAASEKDSVIQKDLAEHFGRKGATITSMLQGLEKKGYIKRVIPKDNERQKKLYLLKKGTDLVEEFNEIFAEVEKSVTQGLTKEECETFMKLLIKVKESF